MSGGLGAQNIVCTGGRYDRLIAQLRGKSNHAAGFAMGIEHLSLLLVQLDNVPIARAVDVYILSVGVVAQQEGLRLAERIR